MVYELKTTPKNRYFFNRKTQFYLDYNNTNMYINISIRLASALFKTILDSKEIYF